MKTIELFRFTAESPSILNPISIDIHSHRWKTHHHLTDPIGFDVGTTIIIIAEIPEKQEPFAYWPGGENPAPGKRVDVITRDGFEWKGINSSEFRWYHAGKTLSGRSDSDIIAWRISVAKED